MAVPVTEFSSTKTDIPGLLFFNVTSVNDDRGYFQEKYHKAKLEAVGLPKNFEVVQNSISFNIKRGSIRGFHAEPWDKYISVVNGEVFAAYVDLRKGDSFGKVVTTTIDPETAVFLPRGVANSFQTLSDNCYYIYSVNEHWSVEKRDLYTSINLADPTLNIAWPIPLGESIMSERDRNHPLLKDVTPMENL